MGELDDRLRNRAESIKTRENPLSASPEKNIPTAIDPPKSGEPGTRLDLTVTDPEVIRELERYPEGADRDRYALSALRLGVLSLRLASGQIDGTEIRRAADRLLSDVQTLLTERTGQVLGQISGELKQYFDPKTGVVPLRIESLVQKDGELEKILQSHLGPQNSVMARTLVEHVGASSPLFKILSPTEATGLKAQLSEAVESALEEQRTQILGQFSLDNPSSALSRLIERIQSSQGDLTTEIKDKVDALSKEFSLDEPNSALSRLLNNLTLDQEQSALSRLKRELEGRVQEMIRKNEEFHLKVSETLSRLEVRKTEQARSTWHGQRFEEQLGELLNREAQPLNDVCEFVGQTTGLIKHCKKGDHLIQLGPESSAPGARIVWEAKEDAGYDLKRGLDEMDEARKNRQAQMGVFVVSKKTAPEGLASFARYGQDIVIVWDAEDPTTDLYVRAAYSVARALAIRSRGVSVQTQEAIQTIEQSVRAIEKQIQFIEQIKTWGQTVTESGKKIVDRAEKTAAELRKEIERLDEQIAALGVARQPG